ncbi:MAG: efflux RND transporter periplasmic adaptor subunit [Planctomycetes bacterium]|nr:efflux RND transporter periplasmic adaptor subunit [Planctomycetota bacterium]
MKNPDLKTWLRPLARHLDRWLALAIGIALIAAFLLSQRPRPHRERGEISAQPPAAKKIQAAEAKKVVIPIFAEGIGTVRSRRQTEIAARILAEVKEIRKQPGDEVKAGEVLAVLDSRDLEAQAEQAEANLKTREVLLSDARTEFERARNLFEREAATRQQLDAASFRLAEATSQQQAAEKTLNEACIRLGYATITAPFDGLIYQKLADPGDLAAPGKTLLGLYDPRQLRLEALVEERLLWKLKIKDRLEVHIEALGHEVSGLVSEVVPAVDPFTRTGTIKIDLPDDAELRPGMFGRARVPAGQREAVAVPAAALVRRGQLELVFTVAKKDQRDLARLRLVRSGEPIPQGEKPLVEILSGLEGGVAVAVTEAQSLQDGAALEPARNP